MFLDDVIGPKIIAPKLLYQIRNLPCYRWLFPRRTFLLQQYLEGPHGISINIQDTSALERAGGVSRHRRCSVLPHKKYSYLSKSNSYRIRKIGVFLLGKCDLEERVTIQLQHRVHFAVSFYPIFPKLDDDLLSEYPLLSRLSRTPRSE